MAKELRCGDVMEGCPTVMRGETEDEVMRKAAAHAREEHGVEEIDDETRQTVQSKIRTV